MTDTFIDWKSERWAGLVAVTFALLLAACATTQRGIAGISGLR
jgi:starvation-inducible outer membrane lipoprotein